MLPHKSHSYIVWYDCCMLKTCLKLVPLGLRWHDHGCCVLLLVLDCLNGRWSFIIWLHGCCLLRWSLMTLLCFQCVWRCSPYATYAEWGRFYAVCLLLWQHWVTKTAVCQHHRRRYHRCMCKPLFASFVKNFFEACYKFYSRALLLLFAQLYII